MKMKKIDFAGLTPLLLQYGDKVVLGVCVAVTVLLVGMGLLSAKSASGTDWAEELKKAADNLDRQIHSAQVPEVPKEKLASLEPVLYRWHEWHSDYDQGPYIQQADRADTKR